MNATTRNASPLLQQSKPDFDRCLQRIEAWFEREVLDRPPIRFYKHNSQYEGGDALDRSRWASLQECWFDVDYQIDAFERSIAGKTFHAETFPVFPPNLGPCVYSAFYVGRLDFAEVTSWYEPALASLEDADRWPADFEVVRQNIYFQKLEELTRAALERCGGQYLVGYTDYHPSLDCVAAWRGPEILCLDMVMDAEKLARVIERSIHDFHRIFDYFDAMVKAAGQPSVTWLGIPSFDKLHIPSCDFASMISPRHFAEFSLPCLRREVQGMTRNIYHVDGKGVAQHLDLILSLPEIHAIQWVQGLGKDLAIQQWVPLLQRIIAAGKSVVVDLQAGELDDFMAAIKPAGLFLCIGVEEGQEQAVLQRVQRWC